jgi:Xaa-Pro aminopeptidase
MRWLLGFCPHPDERPCLLLVSAEREMFLMPALNAEGARASTDITFAQWSDADGPQAALTSALAALGEPGLKKVVLDETMRADFALLLLDALPENVTREFTMHTVGALRMRKDADEFSELKKNALIADRALKAAWASMRPGMSERDVADIVRAHFSSERARPVFAIVGAAGNGAFPHHGTSDTVLKVGDAVVMDIGGKKGAFPSDITRMALIGEAPEGYQAVHDVVEAAVEAALAAAKPGVAAKVVDQAARDVITKAGYGEYFVHRTGHGLGLEGHEEPYITSTSETILDTGMVFSIEPGIYLPGRFGIRLEEIVILRDDGPEILSELPRDAVVVRT